MVTFTIVQCQPGLILRTFFISGIRALWHSVVSAGVPECQKNKYGGLDQYGADRFGRLIFATIRQMCEWKG